MTRWKPDSKTLIELWRQFQATAVVHKDGKVWTIPPPKYVTEHESDSSR
jgi:hypothetical protein